MHLQHTAISNDSEMPEVMLTTGPEDGCCVQVSDAKYSSLNTTFSLRPHQKSRLHLIRAYELQEAADQSATVRQGALALEFN